VLTPQTPLHIQRQWLTWRWRWDTNHLGHCSVQFHSEMLFVMCATNRKHNTFRFRVVCVCAGLNSDTSAGYMILYNHELRNIWDHRTYKCVVLRIRGRCFA
jgi:hypothetical protein